MSSKGTTKKKVDANNVLNLGYGPLSTKYEVDNPKGLWEKIRKGEVSEIYLGDGIGSAYVRTNNVPRKPKKPVLRVPRQNNGHQGTGKSTGGDTVVVRSGKSRDADDSELRAFEKALSGDQRKVPPAKRKTNIPERK